MSGQATTTGSIVESYGSRGTNNQIRPGGDLGKKRYYPVVDASTGKIDVYRYGILGDTKIGSIPRGGNFNVESEADGTPIANSAEIIHFGSAEGKKNFRNQAETVVKNEWDKKQKPPPRELINGDNPLKQNLGSTSRFSDQTNAAVKSKLEDLTKRKTTNTSLSPGETVHYPVALRSAGNTQDHLKLQMLEYSPKKVGIQGDTKNLSGIGERAKNRKKLGSIILPIPGGIMDANVVSWGGDTMDPMAAAMANVSYAALVENRGIDAIKEQWDKAQGNWSEVRKAMGVAIAGMASQTGSQLLKRTQGAIMNPNMELLFNNPSLRQFNFSWKLAPRSADEAKNVIKIIRFFKQGMAPVREEPNLFLKAPNTWKLTYKHKTGDHKYLNRFKECAMLNCGIQYTPDGNYATFEDGVMTAYQMTLSFQELDPVYSDDYTDIPNTEIGF